MVSDKDSDGDGLTDDYEDNTSHTDPNNPDTDGDGIPDGTEVNGDNQTDPKNPDSDGDGLCDGANTVEGVCIGGEDKDNDGQLDEGETNPTNPDSDGDGLNDKDETEAGTDPNNPDSDGDGVNDGTEITDGTDPLVSDLDCGNGVIDEDEACDNGGVDTSDQYNGCTLSCQRVPGMYCGDGIITHEETCDDGNTVSGDGCDNACEVEEGWWCPAANSPCQLIEKDPAVEDGVEVDPLKCGNGQLDDHETCDDGNRINSDGCSSACQIEIGWDCDNNGTHCFNTQCGNGTREGQEKCDDGNTVSGDGCSSICQLEPGWVCDDNSCGARACGDGIVAGHEECDDGNRTQGDGCDAFCRFEKGQDWACPEEGGACKKSECGDGVVEGEETCDEGHNLNPSHQTPGCVDCRIAMGWTCETEGQSCAHDAEWGNGILEGAEECDEGHLLPDHHQTEGCHNGIITPGWRCPVPGEECIQGTCNDGEYDKGEECDDENRFGGDGCDAFCQTESMFHCEKDKGCTPICGDGITVWTAGEECDDGNLVSGDGCSSDCKVEEGFECTQYTEEYPEAIDIAITYRDFRSFKSSTCRSDSSADGCFTQALANYYNLLDDGTRFQADRGHPDFGNPGSTNGVQGICMDTLGEDQLPVYNPSTNSQNAATSKVSFNMWYRDVPGINQTFKESVTLERTDSSMGTYVFDSSAFFPLTGKGYGNEDRDSSNTSQNFGFTSHIETYFQYKGQAATWDFRGDDDVWVFINGKLAMDLGGVHSEQHGTFEITAVENPETGLMYDPTYNLYEGGIYPITFFHAERNPTGSNFKLTLVGFVNMGSSVCHPICGDGILRGDEECEDALLGSSEVTCTQCKIVANCGNGILEPGEQCDDGKRTNTCNKDCTYRYSSSSRYCGDGIVNGAEQCDDGRRNGTAESTCDSQCHNTSCGNGVIDIAHGEECDDGAEFNGQTRCTEECTLAICGDGILQDQVGEVCDDGLNDGSYGHCGLGCTYLAPKCGDGIIDTAHGEQCDNGVNNGVYGTCSPNCKLVDRCGDNKLQRDYEQCDLGKLNGLPSSNCSENCTFKDITAE